MLVAVVNRSMRAGMRRVLEQVNARTVPRWYVLGGVAIELITALVIDRTGFASDGTRPLSVRQIVAVAVAVLAVNARLAEVIRAAFTAALIGALVIPKVGVFTFGVCAVAGQMVGAVLLDLFAPSEGVHITLLVVYSSLMAVGAVVLAAERR